MTFYRAYIIEGGTGADRGTKSREIEDGDRMGKSERYASNNKLAVVFADADSEFRGMSLARVEQIVAQHGNVRLPPDHRVSTLGREARFGIISLG
jgi:hypothetical protein